MRRTAVQVLDSSGGLKTSAERVRADGPKKSAEARGRSDRFNTPSSNPDCTVGFGIAPNQHAHARGLYRRSGISPCLEDIHSIQLLLLIIDSFPVNVNKVLNFD